MTKTINFRKNDIPWRNLIEFHQEIAKRAEESFFSLQISDIPTDRWTSFEKYELDSYSGPWQVNLTQIKNPTFKSSIRAGNVDDIFLGGPCYLKWDKSEDRWVRKWRPIFYKKVKITLLEDMVCISPDQGNWEFSPLVLDFLDSKGFVPEISWDESPQFIFQRAEDIHAATGASLTVSLQQALCSWCNDIADLFEKTFEKDKDYENPSQWILFTPPAAGPITRYQIADYQKILSILQKYPDKIGGLKIYEGYPAQPADEPEILPIVQLNESQKKAVSYSLSSLPATVISGPPGCGKSQVVVSLILNAWAAGKSVLFASNNNQAVDVVFERLQKFESNFPIAIRAGAKKHNRILTQLRDTINFLTGNRSQASDEITKIHHQIAEFERQIRKIKEFINSRVPQKIDEAQRSAAQAYKKYRELLAKIEEQRGNLDKEFKELNLSCSYDDFESKVLIPYKEWLNKRRTYLQQIEENTRKISRLTDAITLIVNQRNQILNSLGMDASSVQNWSWLLNKKLVEQIEAWHARFAEYLKTPIEQDLIEVDWKPDYGRWQTSEQAVHWSKDAVNLAEQIQSFLFLRENKRKIINQVKSAYEEARNKIQQFEIYNLEALNKSDFEQWAQIFNHLISMSRRKTDWLPFSQRSRIERKLRQKEFVLRSILPISVWRKVGQLNESGRQSLSIIIEEILKAIESYNRWKQIENENKEFEAEVENLLKNVQSFFFKIKLNLSYPGDHGKYLEAIKEALLKYANIAIEAAEAIDKKSKKDKIQKDIDSFISEFNIIAAGIPIKEAWLANQGCNFSNITRSLQNRSTPENVIKLREIFYADPFRLLCETWRKASELLEQYQSLTAEKQKIQTHESLLYEWWSIKPFFLSTCFNFEQVQQTLSQIDLIQNEDNIFTKHFSQVSAWYKKWLKFKNIDEPKLLSEIQEEKKWAVDNLKKAIDSLSDEEKNKIYLFLDKTLSSLDAHWPAEQLAEIFNRYSLNYLESQLNELNQRIESLSFEKAKADWIKRQTEDIETQKALDHLYNAYNRNRLVITEQEYDVFKQALKAVPIWITTAQSSHSIPLQENLFDLLVIDEATQCTVTNLIPLIYRASKIVIIGDPEQLPAIPNITVQTENALSEKYQIQDWIPLLGHVNNNIYKATCDILPNRRFDVILLDEHYRSHPLIIGFSNLHIYQKRLKIRKDPTHLVGSVYKCDVRGSCQRGKYNMSWINKKEVDAVVSLISSLKSSSDSHLNYGIVTPFSAQFEEVQNHLQEKNLDERVTCGTAHRFQGDERDIMIFSAVVSNGITDSAARWVQEPKNLINVAVTRARQSLYVVADYQFCSRCNGILKDLVDYVNTVELLRKTSPAELTLFSWMMVEGWNPSVHEKVGDIEVDFILRTSTTRLVVEVDGQHHQAQQAADQGRDAYLKACNYKVLRLPAREILETPSIAIEKIKDLYLS